MSGDLRSFIQKISTSGDEKLYYERLDIILEEILHVQALVTKQVQG